MYGPRNYSAYKASNNKTANGYGYAQQMTAYKNSGMYACFGAQEKWPEDI